MCSTGTKSSIHRTENSLDYSVCIFIYIYSKTIAYHLLPGIQKLQVIVLICLRKNIWKALSDIDTYQNDPKQASEFHRMLHQQMFKGLLLSNFPVLGCQWGYVLHPVGWGRSQVQGMYLASSRYGFLTSGCIVAAQVLKNWIGLSPQAKKREERWAWCNIPKPAVSNNLKVEYRRSYAGFKLINYTKC